MKPVMRIVGHTGTEVVGPALDPSRTRMYVSSQRAPTPSGNIGVTYEIEGPYVSPAAQSVPALGGIAGLALCAALGFAARFAFDRRAGPDALRSSDSRESNLHSV